VRAVRRLAGGERRARRLIRGATLQAMSPTWIWMQAAIVVFVLAGAVIAIVKLV
jgi:hypothetical protein